MVAGGLSSFELHVICCQRGGESGVESVEPVDPGVEPVEQKLTLQKQKVSPVQY